MKKFKLSFLVILLLALSGCSNEERWEGFVYPDKGNLQIQRSPGEFKSLKDCENASWAMLKSMDALQKGYFDCGKNCKSEAGFFDRTCEETIRSNYYK